MRLLYVTPYVPSPIRVRPYELLRSLVAAGVRPTVVCPIEPGERQAVAELQRWGLTIHAVPIGGRERIAAVAQGAIRGLPLQAAYGVPAALRRRLAEVVATERFDLVQIEHLRGAALLPIVGDLPVVYDAVDCISLLLEHTRAAGPDWRSRLVAALELRATRAFERQVCTAASMTVVTSPRDAAALQSLAPDRPIRVVPNGVDLQRFGPSSRPRTQDLVMFSGKMSYHANIAAAQRLIEQIMPLVWQERPAAQLWIVGNAPPRSIQRHAADPRIVVTGWVPQLAPYLQQATVAVSPLRYGVGVQNKVLEAMATATPVVVDPRCLDALQAQPGRELLVADDDRQFAAAILRILDDRGLQQQLGTAGRAYVERTHRWSHSAAMLLSAYQQALQPVAISPSLGLHQPRGVLP